MRLRDEFVGKGGQWFTFSAVNDDNSRAGTKQAFGEVLRPHYDLNCEVIVSIDADPLLMDAGNIANAISFAQGRDADHGKMSRLYAIESQYSTTGSAADHRLAVRSGDIAGFVGALLAAVTQSDNPVPTKDMPYRERVFAALVDDLTKSENKGKSVVMVGENQPAEVHAAVHHINQVLGNVGQTVTYTKVTDPDRPSSLESLQSFADGVKAGNIKNVVIMGGNPIYDCSGAIDLADLIKQAAVSAHISYYKNETSMACQWVSAVAHPLESWKDGLTYQGSVLVGQPLINPLFGGKSELETLAALLGMEETSGQQIVQQTLGLNQQAWAQAVENGFVADSTGDQATPGESSAPELAATDAWKASDWNGSSFELVFKPCAKVYDGRFANNAWLQELPDFFTKISWDNVAQISPATAEALGVTQRGMGAKSKATLINITVGEDTCTVPVAIQPGQADGSIGLTIGYGRLMAGRVGGDEDNNVDPVGHDVVPLRKADQWSMRSIAKSEIDASGSNYMLAVVQEPWAIDEVGRNEIQARMFRDYSKNETDRSALIREGTFESYQEFLEHHPEKDHAEEGENASVSRGSVFAASYETGPQGQLPVITPVSFTPQDDETSGEDHAEDNDDHGHGHDEDPHWPEAFHSHHELFDLTPGVRETYKASNPSYRNMWGMAIDLNKCIGCNSCVIACQSENNIPVVGKAEVWRGRELHWIRIDRYYGRNLYTDDAPDDEYQMVHQPVTCHHCENAPCETVCPVAATVHSSEGLNDMVYNRCIGTRYCGNNCPYKVRRFNYLNYSDAVTFLKYPGADKLDPADLQQQNLMMNPDVTIRSRGVMEKCTFCVQRIQKAKIEYKNQERNFIGKERNEEVVVKTACQEACPTTAIEFGDLNADNDVSKAHKNYRAYFMLKDLNNRPRLKYLARVRNPHPVLIDHDDRDSKPGHGGGHDEEHAADNSESAAANTDH